MTEIKVALCLSFCFIWFGGIMTYDGIVNSNVFSVVFGLFFGVVGAVTIASFFGEEDDDENSL